MQGGEGLTLFAWVFMLFSMGAVTILVGWCFYRILVSPSPTTPPSGPPETPGHPDE